MLEKTKKIKLQNPITSLEWVAWKRCIISRRSCRAD